MEHKWIDFERVGVYESITLAFSEWLNAGVFWKLLAGYLGDFVDCRQNQLDPGKHNAFRQECNGANSDSRQDEQTAAAGRDDMLCTPEEFRFSSLRRAVLAQFG